MTSRRKELTGKKQEGTFQSAGSEPDFDLGGITQTDSHSAGHSDGGYTNASSPGPLAPQGRSTLVTVKQRTKQYTPTPNVPLAITNSRTFIIKAVSKGQSR